jgi:hypothetical protein
MRRTRVLAVAAIACLGLVASFAPASAVNPGSAAAPLVRAAAPTDVVKADWYCGPGRYLDRWGNCRPYGYYGYGWYGYGLPYYYRHHGGKKYYRHDGGKSFKHYGHKGGKSFKHYGGGGGKHFKGGGKGHGGKHARGHGGGKGGKGGKKH